MNKYQKYQETVDKTFSKDSERIRFWLPGKRNRQEVAKLVSGLINSKIIKSDCFFIRKQTQSDKITGYFDATKVEMPETFPLKEEIILEKIENSSIFDMELYGQFNDKPIYIYFDLQNHCAAVHIKKSSVPEFLALASILNLEKRNLSI